MTAIPPALKTAVDGLKAEYDPGVYYNRDAEDEISAHYLIDRTVDLCAAHMGVEWRPISEAPRDGTHVLLFTTCHGVVEAWFAPGEWSDNMPEGPREYSGSVWVCADDAFQIEVEELPIEQGGFHHGTATHWQPLAAPPATGDDK